MPSFASFMPAVQRWLPLDDRDPEIPDEVRADVEQHLDERRGQLNQWFVLVRTALVLGLGGYLCIEALTTGAPWPPYLGLLVGYAILNAGIRLLGRRCSACVTWGYGAADLGLLLLLRHLYALDLFGDPNATLVGLLALVLISYTLYAAPTLNAALALASLAATGASIYLDPLETAQLVGAESHPFRAFLLIEYLSIACLVTCIVALRLYRQIIGYSVELYRHLQAEMQSAAERARREQMEDLNRLKQSFITVLSHELRNPIMPLCTALDVVQEEMQAGRLDLEMLGMARESAGTLQRLVGDYVQLADLLAQPHPDAPQWNIPLDDFVRTLLTETEHTRFAVSEMGELTASGDPFMLRGALTAVLRRAELCTPAGERIQIGGRAEQGRVILSVHDPLSHVPLEDAVTLDDVFAPSAERVFYSANTGLELILAQHALRRTGGRLHIDSAPGRGTTVSCVLPAPRDTLGRLSLHQFKTIPA